MQSCFHITPGEWRGNTGGRCRQKHHFTSPPTEQPGIQRDWPNTWQQKCTFAYSCTSLPSPGHSSRARSRVSNLKGGNGKGGGSSSIHTLPPLSGPFEIQPFFLAGQPRLLRRKLCQSRKLSELLLLSELASERGRVHFIASFTSSPYTTQGFCADKK